MQAGEKGLELLCDWKEGVPDYVVGDPIRIRQVIVNLLGNAIKFTRAGEVALEATLEESGPEQPELHFVIRDTGIGIAPEKQKLIFDAFSQADGSMTRKYGGTGLGLTISARLVEAMHGRIWVESTRWPRQFVPFHGARLRPLRSLCRLEIPLSCRGFRCWWWTTMPQIAKS